MATPSLFVALVLRSLVDSETLPSLPPQQPTTDDLAGLQSLSKNQYSEEIRSNAVAALGVIAQMPQSASLMQTFGTLFIEALGDSSSWVFVEAINAIFDAFAEPDHNRVFSVRDLFGIVLVRLI
jgi:hypothetical protein